MVIGIIFINGIKQRGKMWEYLCDVREKKQKEACCFMKQEYLFVGEKYKENIQNFEREGIRKDIYSEKFKLLDCEILNFGRKPSECG